MIKCLDDNIGLLINGPKDLDLLDNTIIIFTSDHGDLCGEHGRVNKSVPLEASAKVPFIVYYPRRLKGHRVVEEVLSVIDFTPTILSLVGITTDTKRPGRDFSHLLEGKKAGKDWRDAIFMRGASNPKQNDKSWLTVVSKKYKLTLSGRTEDAPWLTDMEKDPDELVNEYFNPEYQDVIKILMKELEDYGKEWNDQRINSIPIKKEINKFLN